MCEFVPHVDRHPYETDAEYAQRARHKCDRAYPCRFCEECAVSILSRIKADFLAEMSAAQRVLVVLATYNDDYLRNGGRDPETFLKDIPAVADDLTNYIYRFKQMFHLLHPDMVLTCRYYAVPEISPHRTDRGVDPEWSYAEKMEALSRRMPLDGGERGHGHMIQFLSVKWRDEERQERDPAQWSDDLIPRLKLDWLYDHVWETKAETADRQAKSRKARGLTGRASGRKDFSLGMPWRWGFIGYQEPRGAEAVCEYYAKYILKVLELRRQYVKEANTRAWSEEKQLAYQRAELSWKYTRKSLRLGHEYYAMKGREMAQAGLPPSLHFKFRPAANDNERAPEAILQRVGRCAALLDAYDDRWVEMYGNRPHPRGSSTRIKTVRWGDGRNLFRREKPVVTYGVAEAREQISKYRDDRITARREAFISKVLFLYASDDSSDVLERGKLEKRRLRTLRRLQAKLKEGEIIPTEAEALKMHGKVWQEMYHSGQTIAAVVDGSCKHTIVDHATLVREWSRWYRVNVVYPLGVMPEDADENSLMDSQSVFVGRDGVEKRGTSFHTYYAKGDRRIFSYLRKQIALLHFSEAEVQEIVDGIREQYRLECLGGSSVWKAWRKGEKTRKRPPTGKRREFADKLVKHDELDVAPPRPGSLGAGTAAGAQARLVEARESDRLASIDDRQQSWVRLASGELVPKSTDDAVTEYKNAVERREYFDDQAFLEKALRRYLLEDAVLCYRRDLDRLGFMLGKEALEPKHSLPQCRWPQGRSDES